MDQIPGGSSAWLWTGHQRRITNARVINARSPTPHRQHNASPPAREESTRMKYSHEVLAPARPACDSPGVRVCGGIARHPARRVGHEAGVGRLLAALREVPAQAGLEVGAGEVLLVGAEAGQVIPPNEIQHVGGERVERDHGSAMAGGLDWTGGLVDWWTGGLVVSRLRVCCVCCVCCVLLCYGQTWTDG